MGCVVVKCKEDLSSESKIFKVWTTFMFKREIMKWAPITSLSRDGREGGFLIRIYYLFPECM